MDIAIVVVAYNRPQSLFRVLNSLTMADFQDRKDVSLYISIDFSGEFECLKIAQEIEWNFGKKIVTEHQENLGLKDHILSCGDLSQNHDAIIVLEDDLFVSPQFYTYTLSAIQFVNDDPEIAGIGLYSYNYNEFAYTRFYPINDGYDNYYMKVPCSSGQVWTKKQWGNFRDYLDTAPELSYDDCLPHFVVDWKPSSWKKLFYKYIVDESKYFFYPRASLTTNIGDEGQHTKNPMDVWKTELLLGKMSYRFCSLSDSKSVYDSFFELEGRVYNLFSNTNKSIEFDLYGLKPINHVKSEFLFSIKKCRKIIRSYNVDLLPFELNVLYEEKDFKKNTQAINFGRATDFEDEIGIERYVQDLNRSSLMFLPYIEDKISEEKQKIWDSKTFKFGERILRIIKPIQRFFR